MRAANAANWAENERFNLQNAFGLQLKRLEVKVKAEVVWSAACLCVCGV